MELNTNQAAAIFADLRDAAELAQNDDAVASICAAVANLVMLSSKYRSAAQQQLIERAERVGFKASYVALSVEVVFNTKDLTVTKAKTQDLTGPALDWAVGYARCLKATDGKPVLARDLMDRAMRNGMASPSTDWAQGGPIIASEGIETQPDQKENEDDGGPSGVIAHWQAFHTLRGGMWFYGPTPLIAAMRCFVASRLGDEVEVPDELVGA